VIAEISEEPADLDLYLSWLRNTVDNSFISGARKDYGLLELRDYIRQKKTALDAQLWGIYTVENVFVGTIKLEPINFSTSEAWLGVMIGAPSNRGKGYAKSAIKLACHYAATTLGLATIKLGVDKSNLIAYNLYLGLGFQICDFQKDSVTMQKRLSDPK
jgi:RimJ/RimL family protein N-acetyltransferase